MSENLSVAIVDDEADGRRLIRQALERYGAHSRERGDEVTFVVEEFASGDDLLAHYHGSYDLLLLDVEMAGTDGLDTARAIRQRDSEVMIVFITNMAQYAIHGYEVNAMSYLVKPVGDVALTRDLDRCVARKRMMRDESSLVFSTADGVAKVPLSHITYLESRSHKIIVHAVDGAYEFTGTLKSFLPQLEDKWFVQANSCYLVNLKYVVAVDANVCRLRDETRLAVSRRRRKRLLKSLADYATAV